ncbi:MAG: hypothetical protein Tsb0013_10290 [Phycisphaerales bacterium]
MRPHAHARPSIFALVVAALSSLLTPMPALAQVPTAPDSWLVVKRDGVQMRCRAGAIWYVVRELEAGQVLRVDGEREGWLGVEYPPGTPAVVRIERVELRENDDGERVAVLTRKSSLYAHNLQADTRDDSYAAVFSTNELEPGTRLPIVSEIERRGGGIGGYLVLPPRGAIGYIQPLAADVRTATEAEIAAFLEASGWNKPEADDTTDEPAPSSDQTSDTEPEQSRPDQQADTSTANNDATDAQQPDKQQPSDTQGEPADDPYRKAEQRLSSLDEAFQRVLAAPMEDAELSGLIDSYESLRAELPDDQSSAAFRDAIDVRLTLLDLRAELQQLAREAADLEARVGETPDLEAVERSTSLGYEAVGRLMPSLIYDGERLPLLYRIVSVDTAYGRTVAYVAPHDEINLASALGAIVGVHGEATTEQDRRVPVLTPLRVDVLRSGR